MNILVVCSQNERRSLTAEKIYRGDPRFSLRSAGVNPKARHFVSVKDIEWADLILYMEKEQWKMIREKFFNLELPPGIDLGLEESDFRGFVTVVSNDYMKGSSKLMVLRGKTKFSETGERGWESGYISVNRELARFITIDGVSE